MLIVTLLALGADPATVVPAASAALRSSARAALPAAAFPAGSALADEQGGGVGKVVSVEQGMVTVKTPHTLIRIPASAFTMRGGLVINGITAAQLDKLARTGMPAK